MVILIVEDEFLIGWTLKLVLEFAGYDAIGPAASAHEALQLAQAQRPELAFVDINIAGDRDGAAVARTLVKNYATSCIFLTARADRAREAKDAALGVITKPYDPYALIKAVDVVREIRAGQLPSTIPKHLELFA